MQQDEHTLTTLLTALPEEPDTEAALVAIRKRIDDGEGDERLPPELFAGLRRHRKESDVVVLHPTAGAGGDPPQPVRRRVWALVAAMTAIGAAAAATVVMRTPSTAVPATAKVDPEEPPAPTVPPRPVPRRAPADPVRDEIAVAEAVLVLGTLHDEDPRVASKPKQGKKRWTASFRRARKVWRRGRAAYQSGDVERARDAFAECLIIDAAHSHCLNSLGRIAADEHDPAAARVLFERAVRADATNPYPLVNLATLAMLHRRLDEAQSLLNVATTAAPELEVVRRLQQRLDYLRIALHPEAAPP